jgi:ABC-type nitrate/sulfonate/bicarbonate transport system permease component
MVLGVSGVAAFLLLWESVPRMGLIDERYLPAASEVLLRLFGYLGQASFWGDVGHTMMAWAIGLAISISSALVLGFTIGSNEFLRSATRSTIEFLRPIPSVAFIPIAVLIFGVEIESSLLLIIYASFWPVLIQTLYGIADVDPVARSTASSYQLGWLAEARHVVWPTALPYIMTGIRLSAAIALILAIVAELIIGSPGLGKQIALTQSGGAIREMYALIVATGMIGVAVNMVVRRVERRVLAWHISVRRELAP